MAKYWSELINEGTLSVTAEGLLKCNTQQIAGHLVIPNDESIVGIASQGFKDCTQLTGIVVPGNIKNINWYAFYGCTALSQIELGEGIESFGEGVFRNCKSLKGLTLPNSVTYFENNGCSFMFCQSLSYINLGTGLTEVPQLYGSIEELIIPDGYTNFRWQSSASFGTIYMPATITHFGTDTPSGFYVKILSEATIHFAGTEEQWNQIFNVDKIATNATVIFNSPYTSE